MSRRSRPPRNRKTRGSDAARHDVAVTAPPLASPADALVREVREAATPAIPEPHDELAELDAGWE